MSPSPGFWSRLIDSLTGRPAEEEEGKPLFRARPVPPPEPRGPGLPEMDDILLEAPRVPDPARAPRPTLVPNLPAPDPAPDPAPASASVPAPLAAGRQLLTRPERRVLERIRVLTGAGMAGEAQALLDEHFARQPHLVDSDGLPVYLIETYRLAAMRRDTGTMLALAERLRPYLAAGDPRLEVLAARAAMRARALQAARDGWHAALARAPGLPEAMEWLARNPSAPAAGQMVADLLAPAAEAPPILPETPPPPPALTTLGLPAGMPARLLAKAALRIEAGQVALAEGGDAAFEAARDIPGAGIGQLAVMLRGENLPTHALGFTELALALFTLCRISEPAVRPARLHVGRQPWALRPVADSPAELLAVLFPGLRVVGGFDGAIREPAVMLLEPSLRNAASETLLGGVLSHAMRCAPEFRRAVFAAYSVPDREADLAPRRRPRALLLAPRPARVVAEPARQTLFAQLEAAGFEAVATDLSALTWRAQLHAVHDADLLLGAHGPQLAAAVAWAHPRARVIELFPPGVRRYDTQVMAEAAGIAYLGIEAVARQGFIARPRDRPGPPRGAVGGTIDEVPVRLLERALSGLAAR